MEKKNNMASGPRNPQEPKQVQAARGSINPRNGEEMQRTTSAAGTRDPLRVPAACVPLPRPQNMQTVWHYERRIFPKTLLLSSPLQAAAPPWRINLPEVHRVPISLVQHHETLVTRDLLLLPLLFCADRVHNLQELSQSLHNHHHEK